MEDHELTIVGLRSDRCGGDGGLRSSGFRFRREANADRQSEVDAHPSVSIEDPTEQDSKRLAISVDGAFYGLHSREWLARILNSLARSWGA